MTCGRVLAEWPDGTPSSTCGRPAEHAGGHASELEEVRCPMSDFLFTETFAESRSVQRTLKFEGSEVTLIVGSTRYGRDGDWPKPRSYLPTQVATTQEQYYAIATCLDELFDAYKERWPT